ncbi:aminotransferase class V-fold PLP-dependent enzyme [Amycolatopsis vancoresmycina]|uniref:Aminotransferase n=1 Tax=Amycolatopsis vancoresmycina DSM 44592 TaxID=1292037 RepID=R1I7H6_9PSEU|nr:aminotransferase class V-fold PLP-dependent enzyme [Amycolatopsis vancoresmycina]EOD66389.1 aminotransferase [Amycolatopsis vancoresmycina DSM 44592]
MTGRRIHFNTAGAGIPAPAVPRVMAAYLALEAEVGPYEAEALHETELTSTVYARLAELVGARPAEIALFGSATDAWCRVVNRLPVPPGSRIWLTPYEYAGNLIALQLLARRRGCTLEVVPLGPDGELDLDWMRTRLDDRVALVSVVHMPSGAGVLLPVERIGAVLAGSAAVYVVDACQTVGQRPVDVSAIGCHVLTAAGRKFLRGPRGSGFAYVRPDLRDRLEPGFADLHAADVESLHRFRLTDPTAARLETAERSNAVTLGLLAAAEHALSHPGGPAPEVIDALHDVVNAAPGARVLGPPRSRTPIVSFRHERVPADRIRAVLAEDGVTGWVALGSHTPLYLAAAGVDRFVRMSAHHHNTVGDVEVFARALRRAVD